MVRKLLLVEGVIPTLPPRTGRFNFDKLREETAQYELMGNMILCVDFYGRIGLNIDYFENDEKDEFLPLPKAWFPYDRHDRRDRRKWLGRS